MLRSTISPRRTVRWSRPSWPGVNRTAKLKFNHPGLATTATRNGGRLMIQNDIGTTDAHVIVIHVEGLTVNVTYTDLHAERLSFFQDMLNRVL